MQKTHERMTVKKLAEAAGVHLETVRFYERKKLLPAPERTSGGHRVYTEGDVERLKFVNRCKEVGFTLKEISTLVRLRDADPDESCEEVMELARAKIRELDAKIATMTEMRDSLRDFHDNCSSSTVDCCGILTNLQKTS